MESCEREGERERERGREGEREEKGVKFEKIRGIYRYQLVGVEQ